MTFQQCDLVGVGVKCQRPLINRATASFVPDGRELRQAADAMGQAAAGAIDESFREASVAQCSGEEYVGYCAAFQQKPRHLRSFTDQPLCGRRFVILVASVHTGTTLKKQLSRLNVT